MRWILIASNASLPWITSTKLVYLDFCGNSPARLPSSVALDQIQLARDLPVSGYSRLRWRISATSQKIFHSTQGTKRSTSRSVPYRQPFQTCRYAALQRGFFWIPTTSAAGASSFVLAHQAEALKSALNHLSHDPSSSRWQRQESH